MEEDKISPFDVCNLSKIPWKMAQNPLYRVANALKSATGDEESFQLMKDIFFSEDWESKTQSLESLYQIESKEIEGYSADTIFLPWAHSFPSPRYLDMFFNVFRDECYLRRQYEKIRNLTVSIGTDGYHPDKFPTRQGHITGYWLSDGENNKFYVTAGNHRMAVIAALLDEKVPVVFEKKEYCKQRDLIHRDSFQNIYRSADVEMWPSVRSGFITVTTALQIFDRYITS